MICTFDCIGWFLRVLFISFSIGFGFFYFQFIGEDQVENNTDDNSEEETGDTDIHSAYGDFQTAGNAEPGTDAENQGNDDEVSGMGEVKVGFGQSTNPNGGDHTEKHEFHAAPNRGGDGL